MKNMDDEICNVVFNIISTKGLQEKIYENISCTISYDALLEKIKTILKKYGRCSLSEIYPDLIFINGIDINIYRNSDINLSKNTVIDIILITYGG